MQGKAIRAQKRGRATALTGVSLLGLALMAWPGAAMASCTTTAPADGQSVTCDSANTTPVIAATSSDVTLDLLADGSIIPASGPAIWLGTNADLLLRARTVTGNAAINSYAILLGAGASVTLDGLIEGRGGITGPTQGTGSTGLSGATITINAEGRIVTNGTANNSAIDGRAGNNVYTVNGTIRATGTSGHGISVGNDDRLTLGATGSITTLSGDSASAVNGSAMAGVTVTTAAGSLIELHGIGRGISLGANANVILGGTIRSFGDAAIPNSGGGTGIEVGSGSTVRLLEGGQIITGNTAGLGNQGTSAIGISTFRSGTAPGSTVIVDGLIDTQRALGIFAGIGDTITIGTTGRVTARGTGNAGRGIFGNLQTTTTNDTITINILGRLESLGTGAALFLSASRATGQTVETSAIANVSIAAGATLFAQANLAYGQDNGAGNFPEIIDNLVVAGTVQRGNAGTVIDLNDGADRITILPTATITGTIDGGTDPAGAAEIDTFALDGALGTAGIFDFAIAPILNFEAGAKDGEGSWTLLGAAGPGLTGSFAVNRGTLFVNGDISGATFAVADGATLGGSGSIGTTNVANGGSLGAGSSPGAIGTLTVNGGLTLGAGSILVADVAPNDADRISVTGAAALGGTLIASAIGGTYAPGQFTLLSAGGGVNGTFGNLLIQGNFSGLVATLSYDAGNVFLNLAEAPFSTSFNTLLQDRVVFNAAVVEVRRVSLFNTRVIGRLSGGAALFDQTYATAFADPATQAGITAARAAVTGAGGPGAIVIVSDPLLISRTVTSSTSTTSVYSLASVLDMTAAQQTSVEAGGTPVTLTRGDTRSCAAAIAALPGGQRPACGPAGSGEAYAVEPRTIDTLTTVTTEYAVDETRIETTTEMISETWELTGTVVPVGTVHALVQSALFEQSGRLLRRLPEQGAGGWGEGYAMRVRHGGRRDTRGLAGGFGVAVAPGLTLGLGVDHGWIDIDVPGALETGEVELTEIGATARFERGPFSAALTGIYGFGSADTLRTIAGSSRASYDVRLTGAALDLGYTLEASGWRIRPVASLDYVRIESDGFTETDTLGLAAADHDAGRTRASAGVEIGRDLGGVRLAASARHVAVLDGGERALPVAFAIAPGTPLVMQGAAEGDTALIGARARLPLAPNAALTLGYDGRFGSGYDGHAGFAGVAVAW